jgi:tetratricopeptide (TPR) repeat protein
LLEQRLAHVQRRGRCKLKEFEARRDILFLDMWSSKTTVEESARALKALYLEVRESGLDTSILQADILTKLFWAAARSFNPVLAEETIEEVRKLHVQSDEPAVRCRTARSLGIYECYKGQLDEAERHLTEALSAAKETGDQTAVVDCYVGLTTLLPRVLRADLANQILETALPLAEQHADPWHITAILCNCAVPHMYLRDAKRARQLLQRARQTLLSNGDVPDTSPSVLYNLGFVAHLTGDNDSAEHYWRSALQVSEEDGVLPVQEECLAALGGLALQRGQVPQARELAAQALRLARRGTYLIDERFGLQELLARLCYSAGRKTKSLRTLARMASSSRHSDVPLYLTTQLTRLELTIKDGDKTEALKIQRELSEVARAHGASWWVERAQRLCKNY